MKDIMTTNEAYELQDFCFICKRHIDAAGTVLLHQWIPTVQAVFLQVYIIVLINVEKHSWYIIDIIFRSIITFF